MEILRATDLNKVFQTGKTVVKAVRGVTLGCGAGEIVAFLGANGAGKTTTLKMLTGLIRPDSGTVRVCGGDPHADTRVLGHIGAVLEGNRNTYWKLTVQENFEYFGALRGLSRQVLRERIPGLLDQFHLAEKRRTQVQQLSRGMQQKLAIALSILHKPKLLLLDEPTLGLDLQATLDVKAMVRDLAAQGCGVLLTTHQLDVAEELADRVIIMRGGEIVTEQPTRELIRDYSGSAYEVRFRGELLPPQRSRLSLLGAEETTPGTLTYFGVPRGMYDLLQALQPHELLAVEPRVADLAEVFLKVQQEGVYV